MIVYDLRLDGAIYADVTPPFVQSGLTPGQVVQAEVRARDTAGETGPWSAITTAETPLPDATVVGDGGIQYTTASGSVLHQRPDSTLTGSGAVLHTTASGSAFPQWRPDSTVYGGGAVPAVTASGVVFPEWRPDSTLTGSGAVPAVTASGLALAHVGDRADVTLTGAGAVPAPTASARVMSVSGLMAHPDRVALRLTKASTILIVERRVHIEIT